MFRCPPGWRKGGTAGAPPLALTLAKSLQRRLVGLSQSLQHRHVGGAC